MTSQVSPPVPSPPRASGLGASLAVGTSVAREGHTRDASCSEQPVPSARDVLPQLLVLYKQKQSCTAWANLLPSPPPGSKGGSRRAGRSFQTRSPSSLSREQGDLNVRGAPPLRAALLSRRPLDRTVSFTPTWPPPLLQAPPSLLHPYRGSQKDRAGRANHPQPRVQPVSPHVCRAPGDSGRSKGPGASRDRLRFPGPPLSFYT